jgi:Methylamine utilisation protein MauE
MSVVAMLGTLVVGGVLAGTGVMKLVRPAALRLLGALELCIGLGVLALGRAPLLLAAVMLWGFAAWLGLALARGRGGEPCNCFSARSKIGAGATARTLTLALLATGLLWGRADVGASGFSALSAVQWLALVCALLACGTVALGWIAMVLAREVAQLRGGSPLGPHAAGGVSGGQGAPRGALEILEEGPPLGSESPLIERFALVDEEELALAVFLSQGCAVCRELEPLLAVFAVRTGTALVIFDEVREQLAWHSAAVPGSPYAVALDRAGVVLAKGTFNTLEQLASIPATARMRREEGLARV